MSKIYRPVIPIWIEEEDMRLIDADALIEFIDSKFVVSWKHDYDGGFKDACIAILNAIEDAPTIDAVEVVRCKDCKYASPNGKIGCQLMPFSCHDKKRNLYAYGFCSYGERKESE